MQLLVYSREPKNEGCRTIMGAKIQFSQKSKSSKVGIGWAESIFSESLFFQGWKVTYEIFKLDELLCLKIFKPLL